MKGNNIEDAGLEVQKNSQRFEKEKKKEGKIVQLIVFNLGDEEFGANIDQVREIIRTRLITPIPNSPDFIDGLTTVRGEIAVVIDLKNRFLLPANKGMEEKHIIMTVQDKNIFGLIVDEVTEVLRISETEIKVTPELIIKVDINYVPGVLMLKDRLIIMLDLHKVLSEEELVKLSENRIKHREVMKKVRKKTEEKELKAMVTPAQPMTANTIQNDNDQSGKKVKK